MTAIAAFILSPIGRWIAGVGIVVLLLTGVYVKGRFDGRASYKAKVERQINEAIEKGDDGRAKALKKLDEDGEAPAGWFRD